MDWCKKGVKVSFIHSNDTGVIVNILDTDLVLIRLDADQLEIPAFTEDIQPFEADTPKKNIVNKPVAKKEIFQQNEPKVSFPD